MPSLLGRNGEGKYEVMSLDLEAVNSEVSETVCMHTFECVHAYTQVCACIHLSVCMHTLKCVHAYFMCVCTIHKCGHCIVLGQTITHLSKLVKERRVSAKGTTRFHRTGLTAWLGYESLRHDWQKETPQNSE